MVFYEFGTGDPYILSSVPSVAKDNFVTVLMSFSLFTYHVIGTYKNIYNTPLRREAISNGTVITT